MIWVALLLILLFGVGLVCSNDNVLSPAVLTSAVWLLVLGLWVVLPHSLPPLTIQVLGCLAIWNVLSSGSALVMQSLKYQKFEVDADDTIRLFYVVISLATVPGLIMFAVNTLQNTHDPNWANALRNAAIGRGERGEETEIYGGLQVIIWQVSYLLELFYYSKKTRWRTYLTGTILLLFAFLTMSKWGFMSFFLGTISVLYFRKKISLKQILIGLGVMFVLFVVIQAARYATDYENVDKNDFVTLYLLSCLTAFDTLEPASSAHWGENVFRAFYLIANKLGLSSIEPPSSLLPFIFKPIATNTYTVMYPFFKDFGWGGVILFAILMGTCFGYLFKKAQLGSPFYILLYTMCVNFMVIQFANEMLMTSLLAYIKQWFILLLPFLATKYKVFKNTKSLVKVEQIEVIDAREVSQEVSPEVSKGVSREVLPDVSPEVSKE